GRRFESCRVHHKTPGQTGCTRTSNEVLTVFPGLKCSMCAPQCKVAYIPAPTSGAFCQTVTPPGRPRDAPRPPTSAPQPLQPPAPTYVAPRRVQQATHTPQNIRAAPSGDQCHQRPTLTRPDTTPSLPLSRQRMSGPNLNTKHSPRLLAFP